jgi:hypothetical protein
VKGTVKNGFCGVKTKLIGQLNNGEKFCGLMSPPSVLDIRAGFVFGDCIMSVILHNVFKAL